MYRDAGDQSLVLLGGTSLMIAVLAGALMVRDRRGIGFEGLAIPGIYLGTVRLAYLAG